MLNDIFRKTIPALTLALTLSACAFAAGRSNEQDPARPSEPKQEETAEKKGDKKEGKKQAPQGTPVFWQEPADIASRNLLLGPGGEEMRPDLKQVVWQETLPEGYSVKWRVRDACPR